MNTTDKENSTNLEGCYNSRRNKLRTMIKGEAALFISAPEVVASRDTHHPYRQDSDFFYFTGITEPCTALLVLGTSKGARTILFLRERSPEQEQWIGERIGLSRARRRYAVDEVREWAELEETLIEQLTKVAHLHYAPGNHPDIDAFIWEAMKSNVGPQKSFPSQLSDVRLLTSQMRLIKEKREVGWMKHAADITAHALLSFLREIPTAKTERHAARMLEAHFTRLGSLAPAFSTIIASGKNATCLHHEPQLQPLWKRELVLIDCGASYRGYASDISRTVPASGKFTEAQAEVYDVVLAALEAGISKAKVGNTLDTVHQAAVKELTKGLVDLGILYGDVKDLIAEGKYRPYYMHRTGHWLGLDVHDISPRLAPRDIPFEPGMVFTVEPGLYFDAKDKTVPEQYRGIGIRIEDDVLITDKGNQIITRSIPVAREEIEAIMNR